MMDNPSPQISRGDIYFIRKDPDAPAYGNEQYAGRPGIVVSCDKINNTNSTVQIVFCTTQPKCDSPHHVRVTSTERVSVVLCEQVTSVSVRYRLGAYLGHCTGEEMRAIDEAIMQSLDLKQHSVLLDKAAVPDADTSPMGGSCSEKAATLRMERDMYKKMYESLLDRLVATQRGGAARV